MVRPGSETVTVVKARVFLRENVTKLGLAPLTSMFFFGENQRPTGGDYRPEVHDSDILLIQSGTGEWITRPLVNPKRLLVTSFSLTNPAGFGLMQRDRSFESYQDLEARYELRPSAWVEPRGAWAKAASSWCRSRHRTRPTTTSSRSVPDVTPAIRTPYEIEYRIRWQRANEVKPPLAYITQTRRGHSYTRQPDPSVGFVVDFEGPGLTQLAPDAKVDAVLTVDGNGEVLESHAYRNDATGGWRLRLRLKQLDDKKPVELRAFLRNGDTTLTPTWSYVVPAE